MLNHVYYLIKIISKQISTEVTNVFKLVLCNRNLLCMIVNTITTVGRSLFWGGRIRRYLFK